MIFSIVVILLVAGIAYFHWVQGMLNGVVSMTMAVIASSVAIGFHEWIVTSILGGKMADYANGIVLCLTFVAIYGIGRILFDSLIPGNVRLPLYLDKVGGLACGLVAAIFAVGTFAVAAQSMPFGPSMIGSTRYEIADTRSVAVPGRRSLQDADVSGSLAEDLPDPAKETGLLLAADAMVVNYATFQSGSGSLAGDMSLANDHPSLLRELFFQRVGIEGGAKHTVLNIGGKNEASVKGLYAPSSLPQVEAEIDSIRGAQGARKLPPTLAGDQKSGKVLLIVRANAMLNSTDTDKRVRFSPGHARLVIGGKDYYPVGMLNQPANIVLATRIDDYLLAEIPTGSDSATIDFVYQLDRADVLAGGGAAEPAKGEGAKGEGAKAAALHLKGGAFFEFKRYGRIDISSMDIGDTLPPQLLPAKGSGENSGPLAPGGLMVKEPVRKIVTER